MADAAPALLPAERRRAPNPSVEEAAAPVRSVRSIRARFESSDTPSTASAPRHLPTQSLQLQSDPPSSSSLHNAPASAPVTPAKKRPSKPRPRKPTAATTTKIELAAFLKDRSSNNKNNSSSSSSSNNNNNNNNNKTVPNGINAKSASSNSSSQPSHPSQSFPHLPKKKHYPVPLSPSAKQLAKSAAAPSAGAAGSSGASSAGGAGAGGSVGSLIEKWSSANSNGTRPRPPLAERHLQRGEHPAAAAASSASTSSSKHHISSTGATSNISSSSGTTPANAPSSNQMHPTHPQPSHPLPPPSSQHLPESVDTFGSSADFDRVIPKTDPGRLEGYAAPARLAAALEAVINHPASGDQSMREYATRGLQHQHQNSRHPPPPPPPLSSHQRRAPRNDGNATQQHSAGGEAVAREPDRDIDAARDGGGGGSSSGGGFSAHRRQPSLELPRTPPLTREELPSVHHRPELQAHLRPPSHQPTGQELVAAVTAAAAAAAAATAAAGPVNGASDPVSNVSATHLDELAMHVGATGQPAALADWPAGDLYIRQLFSQAEDTAERAVQFDEEDDYFKAFELYSIVVDLYYKVIPFLTPEQGVDVHERIKMYTRRCTTIQQAFEIPDSSPITPGNPSEDATASITPPSQPSQLHAQPTPPSPKLQLQQDNTPQAQQEQQRPNVWKSTVENEDVPSSHALQLDSAASDSAGNVLKRTYPDFSKDGPIGSIATPPPRAVADPRLRDRGISDVAPPPATALSASTQAHRDSLSRPISPSKVRASTNSVSREKVAEMQERVNLMQECLNNFTVKRKHLGPARALELAVTTLNANTFGDLKKLEPLSHTLEHKWATELEVLLSMLKEVKEVRPGVGPALREDIAKHLPALEKCDGSVRETMRSFSALAGHVRYVDRETAGEGGRGQQRWWIKMPVVDRGGLKPEVYRIVEEAEKEMRVVFKVCRAINVEVVKSIPVPPQFVESLPKHARHLISKELKEGLTTWGMFKVSDFMKDRNMWNKKDAKEITSNLEKVALIWEARTSNKSFLSRTFDIRGERFHQAMTAFRRCQNAIRDLRRDWPTMSQTELDMAKIQHNQDIGLAGLEAYSRALESRAYRLLTRIRELLDADDRERKGVGEGALVPVRR